MYKIFSLDTDEEKGIFINLKNLEVNYYGELVNIDKYLTTYINYNKLIIINVIPIETVNKDIINIQKENSNYIEKVYSIIKKYPFLNIKLCSTSTRILDYLEKFFSYDNCGYYISKDLNYYNSKFYIFPEEKYNIKNIETEINNNKLVFIITNDDIDFSIKKELVNNFNNCNDIYIIKKL